MEKKVYVLFDKKVGAYYDPTLQPYEPEDMIELYRRSVLSGAVPNAEDLELYYLGSYDDKGATFSTLPKPRFIVYLGDFQNGTNTKTVKVAEPVA